MSGNNEEEKPDSNKVFPLDLASKLTVKPVEVPKGAPLVMATQQLRGMRVLTQTASSNSGTTTVTGPTISIVPQNIIKTGDAFQRTQLAGIINTHSLQGQTQSSGITVARPAQITLATSAVAQPQTTGTTYHVPRGPAAVANLATPRSAVATPIRATGAASTPTGQQSTTGFVTAVRQIAPPRTPSPAASTLQPGTAWLTGSGMSVQAAPQLVKSVVSGVSGGVTAVTTANVFSSTVQRTPASGAPTTARAQVVARAQPPNTPRHLLHSAITIGQSNAQIHSFKAAGGIQALGAGVTVAQVLPARTQALVYSAGSTPHFPSNPRLTVAATIASQRPIAAPRSGQVMATRLAVPVSVNSTRLTVTPAPQGAIYTAGARISAVPAPPQSTVIGTNAARISVSTSGQASAVGRLAVSSAPGALLTSQARLTVASPAPAPSAVVIATQAGRLASVVSLHPVVVANSSQTARTIQAQGPKMIAQPTQGPSIQLTQVPTVVKQQQTTVVPVTVTLAATPTTRTLNVTPATIVGSRTVAVSSTGAQAIPIAKVFPQGNRTTIESSDNATPLPSSNQPANVYIHTGPIVRRSTSPGVTLSSTAETQRTTTTTTVGTYSLPGTAYYYETSSGYTVAGSNIVARPFTQASTSFTAAAVQQSAPPQIRSAAITTPVHGIMSGQSIQFNPVMVVEQKRSQFLENSGASMLQQSPTTMQQELVNPLPAIGKVTSSPRPSILRKRDNDGSPLKAAKNLAPVLASLPSGPTSPPSRPESRDNGGHSSGGSTTISATSSPGLGEHGDDSLPLPAVNTPPAAAAVALKLEQQQRQQQQDEERPAPEMSPRKKPRKQQLTGNDLHEPKFNIEDMQFLSENKVKKEPEEIPQLREPPPEHRNEVTVKKPAPASLLNSYRQTWKSTHNHYLRYTDVKPKDERRPTIMDLANQTHVLQKINGWKIYHLSTQMEDLSDLETQVYDTLSSVLKLIETKDSTGHEKEFNRINELIKGNMQRSKIINDNMLEAKTQMMKIFDHKSHVADIINRCASKRNFKKRDKF